MPEIPSLPATQETAKALYLQGFKCKQIQEKTGIASETVRTWSYRYGWRELSGKLSAHLTQAVTTPILAKAVSDANTRVREALSGELEQAVSTLAKVKPKRSIKGIAERQAVVGQVINSADKLYQWSQSTVTTGLNLKGLSSSEPDEPPASEPSDKPGHPAAE